MDLDDEVCLCFHVTKRKVLNYIRLEKPRRAAQLSDCYGAGTGCGWCRKMLERYFDTTTSGAAIVEPTPEEHAADRATHIKSGGGTPPPGATPLPGDK